MIAIEKIEGNIEALLEPTINSLGYDLVCVYYTTGNRSKLQVFIDRLDDSQVTIDDCTRVSRTISPILDVEDPISAAYTLEVSSPGIERPIKKLDHFKRFLGCKILLETKQLHNGRKRYTASIEKVDNDVVYLKSPEGDEFSFSLPEIRKAHLCYEQD